MFNSTNTRTLQVL